MPRVVLAVMLTLLLPAGSALGVSVSITPSTPSIPENGSVTFTILVVPNTYVKSVTVAYEGETAQDQLTTYPYEVTHQFNAAMLNLTITATVAYNNGKPPDFAITQINVLGLSLAGPASPLRGWPVAYTAQAKPVGTIISQCSWAFEAGHGTNAYMDGSGSRDKSVWSGPIIVNGTIRCIAVIAGVTIEATQSLTVNPRNWKTPITCAQDNEADWGDIPSLNTALGRHRDRDSDFPGYYFVPRNPGSDFTPARTIARVSTGPCAGWWYVSSSTLKCQRETVINKYIKENGPAVGDYTFFEANAYCFTTSPAAFLQAIKNHEYRGTPDTPLSPEGHHGRTERSIIEFGYDPKMQIEGLSHPSRVSLEAQINAVIQAAEDNVAYYAEDEFYMGVYGPNWGFDIDALGAGMSSIWDEYYWTDCVTPPEQF